MSSETVSPGHEARVRLRAKSTIFCVVNEFCPRPLFKTKMDAKTKIMAQVYYWALH